MIPTSLWPLVFAWTNRTNRKNQGAALTLLTNIAGSKQLTGCWRRISRSSNLVQVQNLPVVVTLTWLLSVDWSHNVGSKRSSRQMKQSSEKRRVYLGFFKKTTTVERVFISPPTSLLLFMGTPCGCTISHRWNVLAKVWMKLDCSLTAGPCSTQNVRQLSATWLVGYMLETATGTNRIRLLNAPVQVPWWCICGHVIAVNFHNCVVWAIHRSHGKNKIKWLGRETPALEQPYLLRASGISFRIDVNCIQDFGIRPNLNRPYLLKTI